MWNSKIQKALKTKHFFLVIHLVSKFDLNSFPGKTYMNWNETIYILSFIYLCKYEYLHFTAYISICLIIARCIGLYLEVLHSIFQVIFLKFQNFELKTVKPKGCDLE